jgi:hypothetical protein
MTDEPEAPEEGVDKRAPSYPRGAFDAFTETEFVGLRGVTQGYVPGDGVGNVMRQNWLHFGFEGRGWPHVSITAKPEPQTSAPPPALADVLERIAGQTPPPWPYSPSKPIPSESYRFRRVA